MLQIFIVRSIFLYFRQVIDVNMAEIPASYIFLHLPILWLPLNRSIVPIFFLWKQEDFSSIRSSIWPNLMHFVDFFIEIRLLSMNFSGITSFSGWLLSKICQKTINKEALSPKPWTIDCNSLTWERVYLWNFNKNNESPFLFYYFSLNLWSQPWVCIKISKGIRIRRKAPISTNFFEFFRRPSEFPIQYPLLSDEHHRSTSMCADWQCALHCHKGIWCRKLNEKFVIGSSLRWLGEQLLSRFSEEVLFFLCEFLKLSVKESFHQKISSNEVFFSSKFELSGLHKQRCQQVNDE